MSSADLAFVRDAKVRWSKLLDFTNAPGRDDTAGAIAIALWATLNVDRLIEIAEREALNHAR